MRSSPRTTVALALTALLAVAGDASAQQGQIVEQKVDSSGHGYTMLKVWGSHYQMGYAQGELLAKQIEKGVGEVKAMLSILYPLARQTMAGASWTAKGIESELDGIVAGVKSKLPAAKLDKLDLKVINTFGDWAYVACRSHSTWGTRVSGTTKTLSTRRLDYSVPNTLDSVNHHVLVARAPTDAKTRWVNFAWPGYVVSVTGVNEFGTLASLHDYQSKMIPGAFMPRTVAVRHALTLVDGIAPAKQLDAVWAALSTTPIMTSTFINYYVPEGNGGVLTCLAGQPCSKLRKPQAAYHGAEVLITTNSETDGKTTPGGGTFMGSYYQQKNKKALADHYALMGHTGMHLLSVDYRKVGDMTIWFEGRVKSGVTPTVKVEFSTLFANTPAAPDGGAPPVGDAGTPVADAGTPTADAATPVTEAGTPVADAGPASDAALADSNSSRPAPTDAFGPELNPPPGDNAPGKTDDGGCRVSRGAGAGKTVGWIALALLALVALRRRRR